MAATTQRCGLPPDADALLSAIKSALDRASTVSVKAGVAFLTALEEGGTEKDARARAAQVLFEPSRRFSGRRLPGERP